MTSLHKIKQRHDARTPWFYAHELPVREGRYEVRLSTGWNVVTMLWKGGRWLIPRGPFDRPMGLRLSLWPGFRWRGLSAPGSARGE